MPITDVYHAQGNDTPHQLTDYLRTVSFSPPAVATLTPAEPVVSALCTHHPASQHTSLSSDQPHDRPSDQMCDRSSCGVVGCSDHSCDHSRDLPATRLQSNQIGFPFSQRVPGHSHFTKTQFKAPSVSVDSQLCGSYQPHSLLQNHPSSVVLQCYHQDWQAPSVYAWRGVLLWCLVLLSSYHTHYFSWLVLSDLSLAVPTVI